MSQFLRWNPLNPGRSVEGRPIKAYSSSVDAPSWIYLLGGVHGDEIEGIYVLERLMAWIEANGEWKGDSIAIPILNVDGREGMKRTNARGVDLNRNLSSSSWCGDSRGEKYYPGPEPLSEPENVFLDDLFQRYSPRLIMTFHSWKPLLNYNGNCQEIAEFLGRYNNYLVCSDIEGHPTPGSLGEYGPEVYNCPVLTLEFPRVSSTVSLEEIWRENETGLKALFESDLLKP